MAKKEQSSSSPQDHFSNYQSDTLTRPRDLAWTNWAKFEKVGDRAQGYIVDVFFRKADGLFKDQRGLTLKQQDGDLINVGIKRLSFVLSKTDNLRLGDPLTIELIELIPNKTKGYNATKQFGFFGKNLTTEGKTVAQLELEDMELQKSASTETEDVEDDGLDLPPTA